MAKFVLVLTGNYKTFTMSSKLSNRCDGLKAVDLIRQTFECDIPLQRIEETRDVSNSYVEIEVSENVARLSGLFNNSFRETIYIKEGTTLNDCLESVVNVNRDFETAEIISARMDYQFDKEKFLTLWQWNGFPKEINEPLHSSPF